LLKNTKIKLHKDETKFCGQVVRINFSQGAKCELFILFGQTAGISRLTSLFWMLKNPTVINKKLRGKERIS
jgi:hypothetical protein